MTTDMCWNEPQRQPHGDDKSDGDLVTFLFLMHECFLDITAIRWSCYLAWCCCCVIGKFCFFSPPEHFVCWTSNEPSNVLAHVRADSAAVGTARRLQVLIFPNLLPQSEDMHLNCLQVWVWVWMVVCVSESCLRGISGDSPITRLQSFT